MQNAVHHLASNVEIIDAVDATAAGATAVAGNTIDMQDAFGCLFAVSIGAIVAGAATSVKLQESDDDSTWSDITGSSTTIADDDDDCTAVLDVRRPKLAKRYVRAYVSRATQNATINWGCALKYQKTGTVTQGANASTTLPAAGATLV